ncbi:alpha beta hydrolase fold-3 [Fusarium tjaetaba]|uniref:Alpha beta hydrolase fold-3 n=1 Tax=Fusarium tjaetaba TaxID=1567544 RepID=A0A8H5V8Q3_9HYPO|nr:alpha beta hydrolase fold-3 [Fusarium tjaetaba]KAF5613323.1 alpha beta hydrolase fold-3 [Fusarium tjaetaba]
MAPQFNPNDFSRFIDFDIFETIYKVVQGHEIACHILVPKALVEQARDTPTSPRPIIFRIHGGGFISGSSLFPDFFAPWHLQLALRHEAVIVSCDYRLAPEANIDEIIADIDDFLTWTCTKLPEFISSRANVQVDTTRILVAGDSAGGYLSLITGLNHASDVRAVTASYPLVDAKSRHFSEAYEKPMFGFPQMPATLIDEHKAKVKNGEVDSIITADPQVQRAALMFSYIQNGKYGELFPFNRRDLFILDKIEDGARFPRGGVFVWHGNEDTVVPVEGSIKLADMIKELDPDLTFTLAVREGEHGFDATSSIDEPWFSKGLNPLVHAWLA